MKATEALRTLAQLSASQWGMFTTAQAVARGVSRLDLSRLTEAQHLERLAHGVYRDAGSPGDEFEPLRAVWLSIDPLRRASERLSDEGDGFVVSGTAAAWLHGIGDLRAEPLEFTSARRKQSQRQELRFRVRDLPHTSITIASGLPVTTLEQTIADLVESHTDLSLVAGALSDALRKSTLDLDVLAGLLAPLAARNGFAKQDGEALLARLRQIAGLDRDTLARNIAADSALASLVAANYFAAAQHVNRGQHD